MLPGSDEAITYVVWEAPMGKKYAVISYQINEHMS